MHGGARQQEETVQHAEVIFSVEQIEVMLSDQHIKVMLSDQHTEVMFSVQHADVVFVQHSEILLVWQGEWEVQDKKKKRSNTLKSEKESVVATVQDGDRGDSRPDRSRDRHDHDRPDIPPR